MQVILVRALEFPQICRYQHPGPTESVSSIARITIRRCIHLIDDTWRRAWRRLPPGSRGQQLLPCRCRPAALQHVPAVRPDAIMFDPIRCTVGVIVFKERDQRGRYRNELFRRDIDHIDRVRTGHDEFTALPATDEFFLELAILVENGVRLSNGELTFLDRGMIDNVIRHLAVINAPVRRLDKAVLVHTCIRGQRVDQADVRSFRRLDRADPAVMGRMHVTHFEARTFARQATRPKRRQTALVGDFD